MCRLAMIIGDQMAQIKIERFYSASKRVATSRLFLIATLIVFPTVRSRPTALERHIVGQNGLLQSE